MSSDKKKKPGEMPARRKREDGDAEFQLSAPWGASNAMPNAAGGLRDVDVPFFISERTRLHELYIREQEKTKRLSLILAACVTVAAAGVVLFAPEGRETLSYWIGAALLIFASGAAGYRRVWGKTKSFSFGADQDRD
jgi:hypothetical protein